MQFLFNRRKAKQRVLVLGLDCAGPQLVFDQFKQDLPVLSGLMSQGTWGLLESSLPCITVPAWSSMLSSRDPGELGIYGFRNRAAYDYDSLQIADSQAVTVKRIWDYVSEAGKEVLIANVPQTYPVRPVNGHLISGFLTPDTNSAFTYPAIFKQEVLKKTSHYTFDIRNFRTMEKQSLLQQIIDMTDIQYGLLEQLLAEKTWDFAMHVNMGVDRIHHAFWRYHDPEHRLYEKGNPFSTAIRDYYKQVDSWIGRMLHRVDEDTAILIVSDHGVKRMDGAICINEWLWQQGWLRLKSPLPEGQIVAFSEANVDWSATKAWSTGGYYGRIFLNIAGREPQGIISPDALPSIREELSAQLCTIPGPSGEKLHTQVFYPEKVYRSVNGIAPDLMVYFGDLHWRVVGSMGYGKHYTLENDTGPDDANHAVDGLYLLVDPRQKGGGESSRRQLMDVAPTLLSLLGIAVPPEMQGKPIPLR